MDPADVCQFCLANMSDLDDVPISKRTKTAFDADDPKWDNNLDEFETAARVDINDTYTRLIAMYKGRETLPALNRKPTSAMWEAYYRYETELLAEWGLKIEVDKPTMEEVENEEGDEEDDDEDDEEDDDEDDDEEEENDQDEEDDQDDEEEEDEDEEADEEEDEDEDEEKEEGEEEDEEEEEGDADED